VPTPAIAANFVSLAEPGREGKPYPHSYLEALLALECEERDRMRLPIASATRSCLGMKTLEEFDFAQAPRIPATKIRRNWPKGGYIERKRNRWC